MDKNGPGDEEGNVAGALSPNKSFARNSINFYEDYVWMFQSLHQNAHFSCPTERLHLTYLAIMGMSPLRPNLNVWKEPSKLLNMYQ